MISGCLFEHIEPFYDLKYYLQAIYSDSFETNLDFFRLSFFKHFFRECFQKVQRRKFSFFSICCEPRGGGADFCLSASAAFSRGIPRPRGELSRVFLPAASQQRKLPRCLASGSNEVTCVRSRVRSHVKSRGRKELKAMSAMNVGISLLRSL